MSSKKKKVKSKISSTEVRTPLNLKDLASKQKVIHRQNSTKTIPFIKPRESTPISQKSFYKSQNPAASLSNFPQYFENPIFSDNNSIKSSKIPPKLDLQSETFSQNDGDFDDYQLQMKKILANNESFQNPKNEIEKIIALKYKTKYKEKMNEAIAKQNEIHKFEIDSIKNKYEGKIMKYKEIIRKLQDDYERVSKRKNSGKDVLDPLLEENAWLKNQIKALRISK